MIDDVAQNKYKQQFKQHNSSYFLTMHIFIIKIYVW